MDEKMSKSLNNTILIRDMLQTYTSNQFRFFCLMHHYRSRRYFDGFEMLTFLFIDFSSIIRIGCYSTSAIR